MRVCVTSKCWWWEFCGEQCGEEMNGSDEV